MAEAMIKGMTSHGMKDIIVSDPSEKRGKYLKDSFSIETTSSNAAVCNECGIIILAVKPQIMELVLNEIRGSITAEHTIVSVAAGIKLESIKEKLGTDRLIRVMPNTPALVGKGMSVMSLCECFADKDISIVREILMSIGEVITLPEKHMDAVTAVSGSGPGFMARYLEATISAGTALGLSQSDASVLAIQTMIGTAALLETGMTPVKLREMVTSPGGTTAAGLDSFNNNGLDDLVAGSLKAAFDRSKELGRK